jgi:hypothetical protein
VLPILLGLGIGVAALTSYPWITLGVCGIAYLISIPITAARFAQLTRRQAARSEPAVVQGVIVPTTTVPAAAAEATDVAPSDQRPAHYH